MSVSIMDNNFVSGMYLVDPKSVKFDDKLVGFNTKRSSRDMKALVAHIELVGQLTPLYSRGGLVGDGRHRVKACIKLGIEVKVIDVDPLMSDIKYLALCNQGEQTGRKLTTAQKGIQAYKAARDFGYTDSYALLAYGVKSKSAITEVRYILEKGYSEAINWLWNAEDETVKFELTRSYIMSKVLDEMIIPEYKVSAEDDDYVIRTNNLTSLSRNIKSEMESLTKINKDATPVSDEEIEEVIDMSIDYLSLINTEAGKEIFFSIIKGNRLDQKAKIRIINTINDAEATKEQAEAMVVKSGKVVIGKNTEILVSLPDDFTVDKDGNAVVIVREVYEESDKVAPEGTDADKEINNDSIASKPNKLSKGKAFSKSTEGVVDD